ncbi:MAG: hypothetical protein ACREIA_06560, partial [Opitutaceae bacterium]
AVPAEALREGWVPKPLAWNQANGHLPGASHVSGGGDAQRARPRTGGSPVSTHGVAVLQKTEQSPANAMASAEQLADGKEQDASIATAVTAWSEKECAEALARIEQQAEIDPEHAAVELLITGRENWMINPAVGDGVIAQWMRQAPDAAAKLLANLPEGVERNRATLAAVAAWSAPAPAETAAWVETLPAGETRDEAFGRMTLAWSGQDLEAAMAWLSHLPASRSRDVGIENLCEQLADIYPAMLASWAATIRDDELRRRALAVLRAAAGN